MKLNPAGQMLLICLLGVLLCGTAHGQVQQSTIAQYVHTAWGKKEGAPGSIWTFAQTPDGFLWIGSKGGLYRFDGVNFEHYQPLSGPAFPAASVRSLLALPNGDLWIGFGKGGISLLRDGRAVNYVVREGQTAVGVSSLVQDGTGTIWASTTTGLMRFEGDRWNKVGKDWNFPAGPVASLFVDRQGTLWAGADRSIVFLPKGARRFQTTSIQVSNVRQIVEARNGKLWMAETTRSVRPLPLGTKSLPADETEVRVGSIGILFASDGSLWITTLGDGLFRVPAPEALQGKPDKSSISLEHDTPKDGLTDSVAMPVFQDREGNIWVGTLSGLDRFRKRNLIQLETSAKTNDAMLMQDGGDGIWILAPSGSVQVHDSVASPLVDSPRISSDPLGNWNTAYRDPAGVLWSVCSKGLQRTEKNKISDFLFPKAVMDAIGNRLIFPAALSEDKDGVLWMAIGGKGLFYGKGDTWSRFDTPLELRTLDPTTAHTDDDGRVWFGYDGGTTIYVQDHKIQIVSLGSDSPAGTVQAIRSHHQQIWVAGASGLAFQWDALARSRSLGRGNVWIYYGNGRNCRW